MLSRQELSDYNTLFWIEFKKHMSRTKSSNGKKINWLNYPTEIKNVYLRLQTTKNEVALYFDFQFRDETIRSVFWEQMGELKTVLEQHIGTEGIWNERESNDALPVFCRIQWKKEGLNYLRESDREAIFDFFKTHLVAFDAFYQDFKEILLFLAK